MSYTPVFQFVQPDKVLGERLIDKSVHAGRKLIDNSITGSLFPPTFRLESDIVSENWDGADPINLSSAADSTATVGYALDASAGAIQVMSIFAEGGEIGNLLVKADLTLDGADFATDVAGNRRLRIRENLEGRLEWFDADDVSMASIHVENVADTLDMSSVEGILIDSSKDGATALELKASGTLSDVDITATNNINLVAVNDLAIFADQILIETGGSLRFRLTDIQVRLVETGSLTRPTYSFDGRFGTGMFSPAVNEVGLVGGTAEMFTGVTASPDNEVRILPAYDNTGTDTHLGVTSTGLLRRQTSARKYKSDINYNVPQLLDMHLQPVHYYKEDFGGDSRNSDSGREFFGLIADDVADLHPSLGFYDNATGEVENFHTDGVLAIIIAQLNDARDRLVVLEAEA